MKTCPICNQEGEIVRIELTDEDFYKMRKVTYHCYHKEGVIVFSHTEPATIVKGNSGTHVKNNSHIRSKINRKVW